MSDVQVIEVITPVQVIEVIDPGIQVVEVEVPGPQGPPGVQGFVLSPAAPPIDETPDGIVWFKYTA